LSPFPPSSSSRAFGAAFHPLSKNIKDRSAQTRGFRPKFSILSPNSAGLIRRYQRPFGIKKGTKPHGRRFIPVLLDEFLSSAPFSATLFPLCMEQEAISKDGGRTKAMLLRLRERPVKGRIFHRAGFRGLLGKTGPGIIGGEMLREVEAFFGCLPSRKRDRAKREKIEGI
jgi:hypothetical protein